MKRQIEIAKGARKRPSCFARIEDAVAAIRAGKMVIVVDDEDRENEGDLTIAAEKCDARGDQLHGPARTWVESAERSPWGRLRWM